MCHGVAVQLFTQGLYYSSRVDRKLIETIHSTRISKFYVHCIDKMSVSTKFNKSLNTTTTMNQEKNDLFNSLLMFSLATF